MVEDGEDDPVLDQVQVVADGLQEEVEVHEEGLEGAGAEELVDERGQEAVELADD